MYFWIYNKDALDTSSLLFYWAVLLLELQTII